MLLLLLLLLELELPTGRGVLELLDSELCEESLLSELSEERELHELCEESLLSELNELCEDEGELCEDTELTDDRLDSDEQEDELGDEWELLLEPLEEGELWDEEEELCDDADELDVEELDCELWLDSLEALE